MTFPAWARVPVLERVLSGETAEGREARSEAS